MNFAPEITELMDYLFEGDYRYRVAYGGRSSGKSYGFADKALEVMIERQTDIAVCREFKTTIAESVHKLLRKRISHHKLDHLFDITINSITYIPNGSRLTYMHLHDNETEVKGLEGNTICWIFEAHNLSADSWKYLNPTIRRTPKMYRDPEFWIEFNPEYADDFVYSKFIEGNDPKCKCVYITYLDNPLCPQDQIDLANQEMVEDEEEYEHVWKGNPKKAGRVIYHMFDEKVHVRDVDLRRIEPVANFFMGQDPHTVYYPFCIWLGREPRGDGTYNYYIYNEYPTLSSKDFKGKYYYELRKKNPCKLTLSSRATIYKILDNTMGETMPSIQLRARGIDTRFAKGAGTGSTTNNTRGIIVEMADPDNGGLVFETPPEYMIDSQREVIKELLSWDKTQPMSAFNEPRMFVCSHCHNMIDTFKFHRFDKDGKEKEDEKRKDPSDALKICMATAQMYKHAIKTEPKQYKPVPDTVDNLRSQYLGAGSTVTMR